MFLRTINSHGKYIFSVIISFGWKKEENRPPKNEKFLDLGSLIVSSLSTPLNYTELSLLLHKCWILNMHIRIRPYMRHLLRFSDSCSSPKEVCSYCSQGDTTCIYLQFHKFLRYTSFCCISC